MEQRKPGTRQTLTDDFHLPVLVVEDDEGLNRLIRKILSREGFQVEGVVTGREALAALKAAPDVLLLLDLVLTDMTGREILTELAARESEVPFIIMTGHGDERVAVEMMKLGARDYIVKGAEFVELLPNIIKRVFSDIGNERKLEAMDAALIQAAENWRATFNAIPDFVSVHDLDRRLVRVNKALADHLGVKPEELIGRKCYELLHDLAHPWPGCPFDRALENQETATQEVNDPNIDIPLQVTCSPIFDQQGKLTGVVHVARDISEQKQAAAEISRSRERYRELYDNAPIAYFSIRAQDGVILQCNNQAVQLLGYEREAMLMIKVFDLYADTPQGLSRAQEIFRKLEAGCSVRDEECEMKKQDGSQVWVSVSSDPVLDAAGKLTESRSVVIDISERKRLEAALFQAQKMESIGTLAGGIAHDFNNLLNVIIGYGSMMQNSLTDDEDKSFLANILSAADRATQLTKGLLTFSRKQVLELLPVNINEIITGLEKMLWRIMGEDITMSSNLSAKALVVVADRVQIEQVLLNLAANSRDAMSGRGMLTIDTCAVELRAEDAGRKKYAINPGGYALISVSDSGTGMDAETMERIFDPFFTTKEVGKGTGLGMAIVYGVIKQHAGFINCYSEPGQGTTFKIYLPLVKEAAVAAGKAVVAPPLSGGTETILVAEDDPTLRKLVLKILQSHGYTVIEAVDGQDAVDRFRENRDRIDLVVLDVVMPNKNGSEAYQEIIMIKPGIKALFVSGYPSDKINKMGMLQEGVNFLYKPLSPDTLLRKAREILDHPAEKGKDQP
ncbi:MAG: response regulator [Desulfobulbaceae bacterium]|nr:response regulator [Desulfobulbaceae bacterium]